jgi:hypothetical protein
MSVVLVSCFLLCSCVGIDEEGNQSSIYETLEEGTTAEQQQNQRLRETKAVFTLLQELEDHIIYQAHESYWVEERLVWKSEQRYPSWHQQGQKLLQLVGSLQPSVSEYAQTVYHPWRQSLQSVYTRNQVINFILEFEASIGWRWMSNEWATRRPAWQKALKEMLANPDNSDYYSE